MSKMVSQITSLTVVYTTIYSGTDQRPTLVFDLTVQNMIYRADARFAPSQWETTLQSNAVSHWLGANLESALDLDGLSVQQDRTVLQKENKAYILQVI